MSFELHEHLEMQSCLKLNYFLQEENSKEVIDLLTSHFSDPNWLTLINSVRLVSNSVIL
jgi:hypothetical protein